MNGPTIDHFRLGHPAYQWRHQAPTNMPPSTCRGLARARRNQLLRPLHPSCLEPPVQHCRPPLHRLDLRPSARHCLPSLTLATRRIQSLQSRAPVPEDMNVIISPMAMSFSWFVLQLIFLTPPPLTPTARWTAFFITSISISCAVIHLSSLAYSLLP